MRTAGDTRSKHGKPRRRLPTITWHMVVRIVGLVLIINEAFTRGDERPITLTLYAAMIGLPNFFGGGKEDREKK